MNIRTFCPATPLHCQKVCKLFYGITKRLIGNLLMCAIRAGVRLSIAQHLLVGKAQQQSVAAAVMCQLCLEADLAS